MSKPYDLAALDPEELETLLHKRPDLRKEIMVEANSRICRDISACQLVYSRDAASATGMYDS